jgi:hypothetical protein
VSIANTTTIANHAQATANAAMLAANITATMLHARVGLNGGYTFSTGPVSRVRWSMPLTVEQSKNIIIHGNATEAQEVLNWIMDNTESYSIEIDAIIRARDVFGFSVSFTDDTEAVHFKCRWGG